MTYLFFLIYSCIDFFSMYFLNFHLLYSSTLCLSFISSSSLSNISYFSLPVLPFFFQDLGLSLLSLLWSIFWVICLSPLHLVVFLGFYFVPSSGTYSSSVSFCLTFCVYGVCSADCWIIIHSASAICPLSGEAGLEACAGFLIGVLVPAHRCWSWVLTIW